MTQERIEKTDEQWRAELSPAAYHVLREAGTEPAFVGAYTDTEDPGVYKCGACGAPLFSSETKYHSGSGWPSFTRPVDPQNVELVEDHSYGMTRTEVRCSRCGGHLGHVFDDGPQAEGGLRYCINSLSLDLDRAAGA